MPIITGIASLGSIKSSMMGRAIIALPKPVIPSITEEQKMMPCKLISCIRLFCIVNTWESPIDPRHCFTAPATSPWTKYRPNRAKKKTTGIIVSMDAAVTCPQLIAYVDVQPAMPTGIVCTFGDESRIAGNRKSFQETTNENMATVASPGTMSGRYTIHIVFKRLAPSIRAASSSSRGTASINVVSVHTLKGSARSTWTRTTLQILSYRPKEAITRKSGIISRIPGNK